MTPATRVLRPGLAAGCGSLPHADATAALELLLATTPELLAVPALPRRHPAEGMLGQAAAGMAGVAIDPAGGLVVDDPDAFDPDGELADDLPADAFGAALDVLDRLAAGGFAGSLKLQCTGPVTLGTALVAAGVAPRRAFPAAGRATRRRARALVAAARRRLPDAPLVVVVDEPGLGEATLGRGALEAEDAVDLLSGTLAAVEAKAVAAVHCCATADWGAVLRAGPALVSLPVEVAPGLRPSDIGPFLERGGWIAWGAVPTGGPFGAVDATGTGRFWRALAARWHALADGGVDPVLLRRRALVTPACGLARHDVAQADLALALTARLGARVATGAVDADRRTS